MNLRSLMILVLILAPTIGRVSAQPTESAGPQKWALLVGINDYAEINDLNYCRRDIEILGERMIAAGYPESNVTLLHDGAKQSLYQPFRANIQHHLQAMLKAAGPEDLVLFVFSGHGLEAGGSSYLCPIEAQLDNPEDTLLALEDVYQQLRSCQARQKVLLIDACRNDPRPGGEKSLEQATPQTEGFARSLENPPEGIVVFSSCRPDQVSVEDDKMGHGVFLHFILEGMRGEADRHTGNGDGQISLFELYRYTDTRTRAFVARTRDLLQTPVLRGELTADFQLGDVVSREKEVKEAWSVVIDQADVLYQDSAILQWLKQMYTRQMESSRKSLTSDDAAARAAGEAMFANFNTMIDYMLHRPEALVLSNPSAVTAENPKTLFAIQRAYAFSVRGDTDGALAASTEAITIEPGNPFGYLFRAMAYAEKSSVIATVESLLGSSRDASTLVYVLNMADRSPQMARKVRDVLQELNKIDPELVANIEAARSRPAELKEAADEVLRRLKEDLPLKKALEDYQRIGLGLPCMLTKDVKLHSGPKVVGKVANYSEVYEITDVNGDWLMAERIGGDEPLKGWVRRKDVQHVIVFYEQFQMVLQ